MCAENYLYIGNSHIIEVYVIVICTEYEAAKKALNGASKQAKQLAINANGATVSEKSLAKSSRSYTIAQNAATIATKAFTTALNATIAFAVSTVISNIISHISDLVNTVELTIERQKELDKQSEENRKYSDVIAKVKEKSKLEAETYLNSNKSDIDDARRKLEDSFWYSSNLEDDNVGYMGIHFFADDLSSDNWNKFKQKVIDEGLSDITYNIDRDLAIGIQNASFEQSVEAYGKLLSIYREFSKEGSSNIKDAEAELRNLNEALKDLQEIDSSASIAEKSIADKILDFQQ